MPTLKTDMRSNVICLILPAIHLKAALSYLFPCESVSFCLSISLSPCPPIFVSLLHIESTQEYLKGDMTHPIEPLSYRPLPVAMTVGHHPCLRHMRISLMWCINISFGRFNDLQSLIVVFSIFLRSHFPFDSKFTSLRFTAVSSHITSTLLFGSSQALVRARILLR